MEVSMQEFSENVLQQTKDIQIQSRPDIKDQLSCYICSKVFTSARNLKRHIKNIHFNLTTEKKFICRHCPFKARDNYQLDLHTKIHTGLKAFKVGKTATFIVLS